MEQKKPKKKKNTGLAPGTIVFTGDRKVERIEVHYVEFGENTYSAQDVDNLSIETLHQPNPDFVQWYDVRGLHDPQLIEGLGQVFKIHPLALEDIADTDQRPRMDQYSNGVFVTLKSLEFSTENQKIKKEHVSLYLTDEGTVLSFQEDKEDLFVSVRNRLERSKGPIRKRKADYLLYALMDTLIDDYHHVLENIEDVIDELEESIIFSASLESRSDIYSLRKLLSLFRKTVFPLRELIRELGGPEESLISETTVVYFRDLSDHVSHLLEMTETFRERLQSLQDLLLSELSFQSNNTIQFLTIVSSIFIPLSFLAGLYGMNFVNIPELQQKNGYFVLLGIMFMIVITLLIYFRRKKWL